jgi:hypothetical protein
MQSKAHAWLVELFPEEGRFADGVTHSLARLVIAPPTIAPLEPVMQRTIGERKRNRSHLTRGHCRRRLDHGFM